MMKQINVLLEESLVNQMEELVKRKGENKSDFIRKALDFYLPYYEERIIMNHFYNYKKKIEKTLITKNILK
jgi:metal-responsive CopG/Arc/MetJ family transcriptional regulator